MRVSSSRGALGWARWPGRLVVECPRGVRLGHIVGVELDRSEAQALVDGGRVDGFAQTRAEGGIRIIGWNRAAITRLDSSSTWGCRAAGRRGLRRWREHLHSRAMRVAVR